MTRLRAQAAPTVVAVDAFVDKILLRTLEPTIMAVERLFDAARPEAAEHGEPDGFDGLDRAGPPERLLPTEWLLAADAPDEFVRRYEHRELAYLRIDRTREQRSPAALALFDTGPWQLGRPRIVQLACLVVLSRQAARAGVELRWGTLHRPERFVAAEPNTFERFLAARTFSPAELLPIDAFVDDCLVVSPVPGPPYAVRQLVLTDEGDAVRATLVDRRHCTTRHALLPVPPRDDAVRVLRNPTGIRTPSKAATPRPISNLVFDQAGHKVLARVAGNRLAVYPAPNSAGEPAGRIRFVETLVADGVIAAAGRVRKAIVTTNIVDDGTGLVIAAFGGSMRGLTGRFPVKGGPVPVPTLESPLGTLTWRDGKLRVHVGKHVLTPIPGNYQVSTADTSMRWGRPGFDVSAHETAPGAWLVRHGSADWWHRGAPVISPILRWDPVQLRTVAGVVVTGKDGDEVLAVGPGPVVEVLYQAGEPILDVAVHQAKPLYAVRMLSGRIVVRTFSPSETVYEAVPR